MTVLLMALAVCVVGAIVAYRLALAFDALACLVQARLREHESPELIAARTTRRMQRLDLGVKDIRDV